MNLPKYFLLGALWTSAMGPVAAAAQPAPDAWSRVDALAPGTQIAVTLAADEERVGAFVAATSEILTIRSDSPAAGDVSLSKSDVRRVVRVMPKHRLLKTGAWTGALVMGAFPIMTAGACDKGCDAGSNAGLFLLLGTALGAGVGGALGHFAEAYGADDRVLFPMAEARNRFYPSRPTGRLGVSVHRMTLQSNLVEGAALGQAYSVVWQASPFVSARVEYARMSDGFDTSRARQELDAKRR